MVVFEGVPPFSTSFESGGVIQVAQGCGGPRAGLTRTDDNGTPGHVVIRCARPHDRRLKERSSDIDLNLIAIDPYSECPDIDIDRTR